MGEPRELASCSIPKQVVQRPLRGLQVSRSLELMPSPLACGYYIVPEVRGVVKFYPLLSRFCQGTQLALSLSIPEDNKEEFSCNKKTQNPDHAEP